MQTEDEFEAAKQATAQQAAAAAQAAATPVLPDYLKLERRLRALLDRGLPRDHPNYEAAAQQLAVVQVGGWAVRGGVGGLWLVGLGCRAGDLAVCLGCAEARSSAARPLIWVHRVRALCPAPSSFHLAALRCRAPPPSLNLRHRWVEFRALLSRRASVLVPHRATPGGRTSARWCLPSG